jgi:hypothetical protein
LREGVEKQQIQGGAAKAVGGIWGVVPKKHKPEEREALGD